MSHWVEFIGSFGCVSASPTRPYIFGSTLATVRFREFLGEAKSRRKGDRINVEKSFWSGFWEGKKVSCLCVSCMQYGVDSASPFHFLQLGRC